MIRRRPRPHVFRPSYGIDLLKIDGTRDGYFLNSKVDRAGAVREARNLSMMSGVRVAVVTTQEWDGRVVEVARFASPDGEHVVEQRVSA